MVIIRKIIISGKEFLEVAYRKTIDEKWNCADIHSDWREAEKQYLLQ